MDIQASNTNNSNRNIDREQSTLEKLQLDVKSTIFGTLFILLKEQEISIYFAFVLSIIQFMHISLFCFHRTVSSIWNAHDITDIIEKILGGFSLVPYLKETNWDVYIIFLYIALVIVVLALVDVFYITFTFTRSKLFFTWPMVALKNILTLFTTILFFPFLDYFVSILACVDNGKGKFVHSYFSDVECWTGIHILHTIFAIIGSLMFVSISLVAALTYFEYKVNLNNPTARVSSRPNFLLTIYQTILTIALTFLTGEQFEIILLILILGGSYILFRKFYFNPPYHDEAIAKLYSTLSVINLWTALMLVIARIIEGVIIDGVVIAWLLGIPFVIFLNLTIKDHRMDLLLINVNKFQDGAEVQNQIRYILKLIQWQSTNKNAGILLDGYIEVHRQTCNKDDCPVRQKVVKNNRFTKALMNQDETLTEKYALLIQLLYMMYFYGIKKFANNTSLRISYAFFLLEKMHSKQQALQELTQAEQNSPDIDEQFIIYRYKKIIEDEIAESQTEIQGGLDVISEVNFQTNLRQLQANIEKSALLHMEFWSQLSEDNPDLAKLSDIGYKINTSVQYIEDNWIKLLKINPANPKAMRLYGKFLIEIINDKEGGEDLLEKARNITNSQAGKKVTGAMAGSANSYSEATPSISISGEHDNFGIITACNLVAASLFGYNKTELLNRKVNVLMSQVFSKYHDSFLENYLNSGESIIIGKNKERFVFGKNKTNYIFPVYLSIRAVQSIIQGIQFIANFRIEKNFKTIAYIVTTTDGTIDAISSSCINLLKIDIKAINKRTNIQDFFPDIIKNRFSIFTTSNSSGKFSATLNYEYPKDSEYLAEIEESSVQLTCHLSELTFQYGKENAGLQWRFERLSEKVIQNLQVERKAKISNFQFKFEKGKPVIHGEYAEVSSSDYQSGALDGRDDFLAMIKSTMDDPSVMEGGIREMTDTLKISQAVEEPEVKRVDYGVGIKTLKLFHGRPQEIEDDKQDENEEEEEVNNVNPFFAQKSQSKQQQQQQTLNQDEENQEEGSYRDFNTAFKSRKALSTVINDKAIPSTVKNLKLVANFLCLTLVGLAIAEYVISTKEFRSIQKNIDLLDKSNQRLAEIMSSLSGTRDLNLLNLGILTNITNESTLRNELRISLDNAKSLKEDLEQETGILSPAHLNLLNQPVIELQNIDLSTNLKGLTQATEEIISKAYEVLTNPLSNINSLNPAYYYVTYNTMNSFYIGLRNSSEFYAQELISKVSDRNSSFLPFLISSAAVMVLSVIILCPILYQVNKAREEVLRMFLDIPEKIVKNLYNKCQTFVSTLQVGEEDDIISEVDEDELEKNNEDPDVLEIASKKKRKRFKFSGRSPNLFFVKLFLMAVIVESYYLYNFFSSRELLGDINSFIAELNSTSIAEGFYSFSNNAERLLFMNSSMPIINKNSMDVVTSNIKDMYYLDSLILQEHSINRKIHSDDYNDEFNLVMMNNPCPSLVPFVESQICQNFADQTIYQGMTVGLTRYFENIRTLLSCYSTIKNNENCSIVANNFKIPSKSDQENKILNLLLTNKSMEIDAMQHLYIKQTFRILMAELKSSLNYNFDIAITRKLIIFVVFLIAVIGIYVGIWLPLMRKISFDIWKTKSMLSMIPLHVIAKIKSIRFYLKKFWNERNLSQS